jgi:hypothetical protein
MTWNPRFAAFARAHGETPEEMHARQPNNVAFVLWIGARWREWRALNGLKRDDGIDDAGHAAFDVWLESRTDELASARSGL